MATRRTKIAAATGRILIWRGGSLWIGRGGEPARAHAHHAIQVTLAFPGDHVKVRLPGGTWRAYKAFIVAAQQRHEFDARDQRVAQLFVEPDRGTAVGCSGAIAGTGSRSSNPASFAARSMSSCALMKAGPTSRR